MGRQQCPYEVLSVSREASDDEIKKSYRRLAIIHHPDKNQGNPEATKQFQSISGAYSILSDQEKRRHYDMTGSLEEEEMEGTDMGDLLEMFFASMGGGNMFGGGSVFFETGGRGGRKGKNQPYFESSFVDPFMSFGAGFHDPGDYDSDLEFMMGGGEGLEEQLMEVLPALFCEKFLEEHEVEASCSSTKKKSKTPTYRCTLCQSIMRSEEAAEMHFLRNHKSLVMQFVEQLEEEGLDEDIEEMFEEFAAKVRSGVITEKRKKKPRRRGPVVRKARK